MNQKNIKKRPVKWSSITKGLQKPTQNHSLPHASHPTSRHVLGIGKTHSQDFPFTSTSAAIPLLKILAATFPVRPAPMMPTLRCKAPGALMSWNGRWGVSQLRYIPCHGENVKAPDPLSLFLRLLADHVETQKSVQLKVTTPELKVFWSRKKHVQMMIS